MRARPFILLAGLALVLSSIPARAGLSFVLTPTTQSGTGTNEVFFTGILTNTSASDSLFLNNAQFVLTNAATNYFTADTNSFFANVPGILSPGQAYQDVVFGVIVATNTPPGTYAGTVTLQGGANITTTTNLSSLPFQITFPTAVNVAKSGSNFVFSWPAPPVGFILQQNPDLSTTNWVTMTNAATVTNGQNRLFLSSTNSKLFYRLTYP